jgi:ubiquinone/menaquinone biosynthesis C-methylase UbiE
MTAPGDSQAYFQAVASQWDALRQAFFSEAVREKALGMAEVAEGKLAVDAGAGTGFVTEALARRGVRVIAVEPSPAMLGEMRSKLALYPGIDYRLGAAEALPVADDIADYAFGNMVLHHVASPQAMIQDLVRVLAPGGRLVLTDLDAHAFDFLRAEHHDRWMGFQRSDVRAWFQAAGLRNVRIECVGENCSATSSCGCEQASVSIFAAYGEKV